MISSTGIAAFLVALAMSCSVAAEPPLEITKVSLIVSNFDRALAVYRDALGFTVDSVRPLPTKSNAYNIFGIPVGTPVQYAVLGYPSQPHILSLYEVKDAAAAPRPAMASAAIVIHVVDYAGAVARLRKTPGVTLLTERRLIDRPGDEGYEIAFIDPDGHRILIFRRDTDK